MLVLASAAAVGLAAAFVLSPRVDDTNGKPDAPIEWNAVQAVPKRALTPDEIAWEKRGELISPPPRGEGWVGARHRRKAMTPTKDSPRPQTRRPHQPPPQGGG